MAKEFSDNIFLEKILYLFFYLTLIIIILFFSALISGSETSFFCLNSKILKKKIKKDSYKENLLLIILKNKKKLLATILIFNNISNIGIVILTSYLISIFFKKKCFLILNYCIPIIFLVKVVFITFILLLFGEIIPKIYASRNKMKFSIFMSKPIIFLLKIFNPISNIIISITGCIEKKIRQKKCLISIDQLSEALKITSNKKNIKEINFLQSIVDFSSKETHQIMTPRIDIFSLNKNISFNNVLKLIRCNVYSRIPVYNKNIDDIEGILYAKDLIPFINKDNVNWNRLIYPPFFVPDNKKIDDLLNDFKKRKIHLAIVVDEYGGTCGIVTLEDVIEEIVGDIIDEFDKYSETYSKICDNNYFFDGKTTLINFYKIMNIKEKIIFESKKGEADTLGGFIMEINKNFPKLKQKINFLNYYFIIKSIQNKRIKTIEVIREKITYNNNFSD